MCQTKGLQARSGHINILSSTHGNILNVKKFYHFFFFVSVLTAVFSWQLVVDFLFSLPLLKSNNWVFTGGLFCFFNRFSGFWQKVSPKTVNEIIESKAKELKAVVYFLYLLNYICFKRYIKCSWNK